VAVKAVTPLCFSPFAFFEFDLAWGWLTMKKAGTPLECLLFSFLGFELFRFSFFSFGASEAAPTFRGQAHASV
jgi:hypothetical protein